MGTGEILRLMGEAGAEVVGVDWRVPLDVARARIGPGCSVQGNLDPTTCLAPWPVVEAAVNDVLRRGGGTGHIFNLGHGVLPETDPDVLAPGRRSRSRVAPGKWPGSTRRRRRPVSDGTL